MTDINRMLLAKVLRRYLCGLQEYGYAVLWKPDFDLSTGSDDEVVRYVRFLTKTLKVLIRQHQPQAEIRSLDKLEAAWPNMDDYDRVAYNLRFFRRDLHAVADGDPPPFLYIFR